MRPPDENPTGSTRPPFMSATRRPSASEDNILARLDRDGMRRSGKSWKRSWIAWCGLASLVIIGLIGVLAALAQENLEVHGQPTVVEAKATSPDPYAAPDSNALLIKGGFAPLPAATAPRTLFATVIDVPPERVMVKADKAELPPLVMLKQEAPPPAAPVAMPVATPPATPPELRRAPPAPPVKLAVAKPAQAPLPIHKAAPTPSAKAAPAKPATFAKAPPRPKKSAPAATAAEPAPLDSDVALLSAILLHADRHAGERAQPDAARCAGKKCALAQKATD